MSESDDGPVGIVGSLESLLKDLKDTQVCVTKLLAAERRARRDDTTVEATLLKLRKKVVSVREGLDEVAFQPIPAGVKVAKGGEEVRKRGRLEVEEGENEDSGEDVAEGDHDASPAKSDEGPAKMVMRRPPAMRVPDVAPKPKLILDGMVARNSDGSLLFFSLLHKQDATKKLWICPVRTSQELFCTFTVQRRQLQQVEFETLLAEEKVWYLAQLEQDILRRFEINFPVLFTASGFEMIIARDRLLKEPNVCTPLTDSLAKQVEAMQLSSKTSPALSATNNTALMIVATLHRELSAFGEANWYQNFVAQVKAICQRCNLTFSTMERYRKVGELMLRCSVIGCLLPSFVASLEAPIIGLLDNPASLQRLEDAFREQMIEVSQSTGGMDHMFVDEDVIQQEDAPLTREIVVFDRGGGVVVGGEVDLFQEAHPELGVSNSAVDLEKAPLERNIQKLHKCRTCKSLIAWTLCDDVSQHNFCWKCAGYAEAPLPEVFYPGTDQLIHTYHFCKKHLAAIKLVQDAYADYVKSLKGDDAMSVANFVRSTQAEEARQLVEVFSRDDCEFSIVPIEPSGWCIFAAVALAIDVALEQLILSLQGFVAEFVASQKGFMNDVKQFVYLWQQLDPNDNSTVQELWSSEDGDILLPMIAEFLNREDVNAIQIIVWKIVRGVLKRQSLAYPNGDGNYEQSIDLLQTNLIVPHWDLLCRKVEC